MAKFDLGKSKAILAIVRKAAQAADGQYNRECGERAKFKAMLEGARRIEEQYRDDPGPNFGESASEQYTHQLSAQEGLWVDAARQATQMEALYQYAVEVFLETAIEV